MINRQFLLIKMYLNRNNIESNISNVGLDLNPNEHSGNVYYLISHRAKLDKLNALSNV